MTGAGNQPRFTFSDQRFEVLGFSGREGISALFAFQLDLVTRSRSIDFSSLLDQAAHLTIKGREGTTRHVHGIVIRFEVQGVLPARVLCRAHLAPPHLRLSLRRRLRVFQDRSVQQIVTQVLQEGGVSGLEWKLREPTTPRNYCVQYRETDLAFVARLLEEEGIAYRFEHGAEELKTIFTDDNAALPPISGAPQVSYNVTTTMVRDQEHVSQLGFGQRLVSGRVQLRDYCFKKPRARVEGVAEGVAPALEVYDYPGEFVDPDLGKRLAGVRLQELQRDRQTGTGSGDCIRFVPGSRFTLGGSSGHHPFQLLNQEYLLVEVSHSGRQPAVLGEESEKGATTYSNTFTVIPASTPFRPARVTERPRAPGVHTAIVLGPPGEQIYVDKYGRVKVRFHWDREEKATSWVRVSQEWAGSGYGSLFLPRVGQEVLVSFLDGDPDRPVITGRVYNGEQVVPYELPGSRTRSTIKSASSPEWAGGQQEVTTGLQGTAEVGAAGYNELRFEDLQDSEEIFLHAQRDQTVVVENDRTTLVRNDRYEQVQHDQRVTVGNDSVAEVAETSTHRAKTMLIQASEKLTLKVGGSSIVLQPDSIKIGSDEILSSGLTINDLRGGQLALNCGQAPLSADSATLAKVLQAGGGLVSQLLGPAAGQVVALAKLLANPPSLKGLLQGLGQNLLGAAMGAVVAKLPESLQRMVSVASSVAPLIQAASSGNVAGLAAGVAGRLAGAALGPLGGAAVSAVATFFGPGGESLASRVGALAPSGFDQLIGAAPAAAQSFTGLVQEGYSKVFGAAQGFEAFSGSPAAVLERLTGGQAVTCLVDAAGQQELWTSLGAAQAGSCPTLATSQPAASGVIPGASYPVTGVAEEDGARTVQLLDPGSGREQAMPYDQFCSEFGEVAICKPAGVGS